MKKLINILTKLTGDYYVFDFTKDFGDGLNDYVRTELEKNNCTIGIGRYGENRTIYQRSDLFSDRSVHLGVDIFAPVGTNIFSPLVGTIHSFCDNNHFGDYGPTIILQHQIDDIVSYTLYGHLSRESLQGLEVGREILAAQKIGEIGNMEVNGNWPPHLHFQIINNILGRSGDFPGVASPNEQGYWLSICPDPNSIF